MKTRMIEGNSQTWWAVGIWKKVPRKRALKFKPLAILPSRKVAQQLCAPGEVVRRLAPRYLD